MRKKWASLTMNIKCTKAKKQQNSFFFFPRKMRVVAYDLTRSYELENFWKTILGPYYRTFVSRTETQTLLQVIMHLLYILSRDNLPW